MDGAIGFPPDKYPYSKQDPNICICIIHKNWTAEKENNRYWNEMVEHI